jgi:secondary thiamine-phosphate synthase enzyme
MSSRGDCASTATSPDRRRYSAATDLSWLSNSGGMDSSVLEVDTSSREIVDLTDEASAFCRGHDDGLLHVFAPHATVGLALMETGSGSEEDLVEALERLLPRHMRYKHAHGTPGHGADHLLPVLLTPALTIPVEGGSLLLGTWQRIVLVDLNADNPIRHVRLSFLASG